MSLKSRHTRGPNSSTIERPPAFFIGGAPALDFLNSIASPADVPVEWIDSGEGLLNWLAQAGMVEPETLDRIRTSAGPGELDAVAAQARALRDWFRGFVTRHMGRPLKPDGIRELEPLNRILARDELHKQLVTRRESAKDHVSTLELVTARRWRSPETLLIPIATAMADLLASVDFTHVKGCEWHTCTLLFLDSTRGRARRWCSMAVCGNRAKQAAYRRRSAHPKGQGGNSEPISRRGAKRRET